MPEEKKKRKRIRKLLNRYRLVVMNDDTFEERLSLSLTPLRVFTLASLGAIIIISVTTYIIAFTPLREYIPGYGGGSSRRDVLNLTMKVDSLEKATSNKERFYSSLKNVLDGRPELNDTINTKGERKPVDYNKISVNRSTADSMLRVEVERADYGSSITVASAGLADVAGANFYKPVVGILTSKFNPIQKHYGVDIAAPADEPVKSVLDGTVIASTWTIEYGNTIQVQHGGNMVSTYKHNSALLKKEGDAVKAGEVIALVGEEGQHSTGPHLHFELWYNGTPVNPNDYINF